MAMVSRQILIRSTAPHITLRRLASTLNRTRNMVKIMLIWPSQPSLPAMPPHAAGSALPSHRVDRDRLRDHRPRRPNLPSHVEHPAPQLLGILDLVPRAVAADDKPMRRANSQLLLDQQEVAAHLCPVPRPERP